MRTYDPAAPRLHPRRSALLAALLLIPLAAVGCRGQAGRKSAAAPATSELARGGPPELRAMVDSMLPRLEVLSGLAAEHPIRLATTSRQAVRAYVVHRLDEDLPPAQLEGVRATYAALGLIPDTLDLRRLLVNLYTEQVGGYYDPHTKTFYTLEGTPPDQLRTVLAHELVHALQDQHADIDSLIAPARGNDRDEAAQAAIEGQATAVMFAMLAERASGGAADPARLPDLGAQLRPALEMQNAQFPVFRSAPVIIRETMLFPYLGGASFVQTLWRRAERERGGRMGVRPWPAPFDSLLPLSTEQVMHPDSAFFLRRDTATAIVLGPTPAAAAGAWTTVHEDVLGALETGIFLRQHLGPAASARGWDGDRFRLLRSPAGGEALVWYSVWDDAGAADAFADAYRRTLAKRPGRTAVVARVTLEGRPGVRVVDVTAGVDATTVPLPPVTALRPVTR